MFVIEILPLKKALTISSLSYFSKEELAVGSIVQMPVRGQHIAGIVISCSGAASHKSSLRSAEFRLRKLPEQTTKHRLPKSVIRTAHKLAEHSPYQLGTIMLSLLPREIRDGFLPYPECPDVEHKQDAVPAILQATFAERIVHYRSYIRTALAHRGSTLLVAPTAADITPLYEALKAGIEDRVITINRTQTPKQRAAALEAFADVTAAKLIITTPQYALLDRCDLTHLIIEQSNSPYYRQRSQPYLSWVDILLTYAKCSERSILLGDILPATEHEDKRRMDVYQTADEHPNRIAFTSTCEVIELPKPAATEGKIELFAHDTVERIKAALAAREHVFIYAARRGLATFVTCFDCGHIFRCPDSGVPYSLLRVGSGESEERWFISSTSGRRVRAADVCPQCGGWRLKERGIGIQQLSDELLTLFPRRSHLTLDHTTATTHNQAKRIAAEFASKRGGLLLGTAMAIPYLPDSVTVTVVSSFDAVRAVQSWRADEHVIRLLLHLRDRTSKALLIQSRTPDDPIVAVVKRGAVESFYQEEIALREALQYPPFTHLVLLTFQGSTTVVKQIEDTIRSTLKHTEPHFYNNPYSTATKVVRYGLLRLDQAQWNNPELFAALRSLPPYIKIEIDPDRIV